MERTCFLKTFTFAAIAFIIIVCSCAACTKKQEKTEYVRKSYDEWSFDDNILISIFWPPTQEYINDEQFQLMADAEIDWIPGAGDNLGATEDQIAMLELCEKYGIHMTVGDSRLSSKLTSGNKEEIQAIVKEFSEYKAAKGYFLVDEPKNPNKYYDVYKTISEVAPDTYLHLNFLPYYVYSNTSTYMSQMNDWAKLCAQTGNPLQYLMYDMYPFGLTEDSFNRTAFLTNANCARIVGLRNNVKTASYIQSVEQSVAFRSPNKAETLFEVNMSLAFGQKQISYFTWFTPVDRDEPFADGIISADGVPNKKYKFICEINHYVHMVGKTLVKCDALEVYTTDSGSDVLDEVPEEFFAQPADDKSDVIYSYMRDKTTGRNYLMVVNNSFTEKTTAKIKFIDEISKVQLISDTTGELTSLSMKNHVVKLELEAGGAAIIALPEDYDYEEGREWIPEANENLALHSEITCDSSRGSDGYYMDCLNDKKKYSDSVNGWMSDTGSESTVVLEFEQEVTFNRVDLYPTGNLYNYGENMAGTYVLSASSDGKNYTEITNVTYDSASRSVLSVTFKAQTGRYLKIEIKDYFEKTTALCEIEVYNDDGSVSAPESLSDQSVNDRGSKTVFYKVGQNIAKNKTVTVSTYPEGSDYKSWGWWPNYLVDENYEKGWTSNVKINDSADSTEYAIIDLGDYFTIDKIVVSPMGSWPVDFQILVSDDMVTWNLVVSETDSKEPEEAYETSGNGMRGRYVLFKATKLRKNGSDGYLLQLGEIEVYGSPYVDYEEAETILKYYLANGGSESDSEYIAALALVDAKEETLTQSKLDSAFRLMLNKIGKSFSDVE